MRFTKTQQEKRRDTKLTLNLCGFSSRLTSADLVYVFRIYDFAVCFFLNINDSEININFIICNFSLNNKKLCELCNQEKNTMAKILTGVQSTGTHI
jgi:hypothetical protein